MGHVEFQISQIKFVRNWAIILGAGFGIPLLFREDLHGIALIVTLIAVGFFAFCTLAIRSGKKVLKHLEKHPEDASDYDDNPLG